MTPLSKAQLDLAVDFNRRRHYPQDMWVRVQQHVGSDDDGVPGRQTASRVAEFQAKNGLPVDGKVGEQTLAAMGITRTKFDRIHRFPGDSAFFYLGQMAVDADGAPNAYNPDNTGIDALANAGKPGRWWGLATDEDGEPFIQRADDPYPGYYVSTTALCDHRYPRHDPRGYVDATQIPYIVLPGNLKSLIDVGPLRKGDLAAVCLIDKRDNIVFSIYADVGPRWVPDHEPGEGSVALAQALGHDPYVEGRIRRGIVRGVFYLIFPGTGTGQPLPIDEIRKRGSKAFEAWGGQTRLTEAIRATGTEVPTTVR